MKIEVGTELRFTDSGRVGLYTSLDEFEHAIDQRALAVMVEEYCQLFQLPGKRYVVSSDCYDLLDNLRAELVKALDQVNLYVDATARSISGNKEE